MFPAWCEASNATEPRVRNATQFPQKLIGPMSQLGPDCVKTRMLGFAGAAGWLMKPSLCSDRFY
jgi:hypothetical protein